MAVVATTNFLNFLAGGTGGTVTKIQLGNTASTPSASDTTITPLSPARETVNPDSAADQNTVAVSYTIGSPGDSINFVAKEVGVWVTPTGGTEFLAIRASDPGTNGLNLVKVNGATFFVRVLYTVTGGTLTNLTVTTSAIVDASQTAKGIIELATTSEFNAGDSTRAVTGSVHNAGNHNASRLTSGTVPPARLPQATESAVGGGTLATKSEAEAGNNTTDLMTPVRTKDAINSLSPSRFYKYVRSTTATNLNTTDKRIPTDAGVSLTLTPKSTSTVYKITMGGGVYSVIWSGSHTFNLYRTVRKGTGTADADRVLQEQLTIQAPITAGFSGNPVSAFVTFNSTSQQTLRVTHHLLTNSTGVTVSASALSPMWLEVQEVVNSV